MTLLITKGKGVGTWWSDCNRAQARKAGMFPRAPELLNPNKHRQFCSIQRTLYTQSSYSRDTWAHSNWSGRKIFLLVRVCV